MVKTICSMSCVIKSHPYT